MRVAIAIAFALLLGSCGVPVDQATMEPPRAQPVPVQPEHSHDPDPVDELSLPASFVGTLPCADCAGIRHHLDLWPDGVFHLRMEWLDTPGVAYDRGRWRKAPEPGVIMLRGASEPPLRFEVKGPRMLRKLDLQGRPIRSDLPYELISDGTLIPVELSLGLHGMFRYYADAARFEECFTGRSYPVAMKGDYLDLERAYLRAQKPEPGAPLLATFEGDINLQPAMEGDSLIPTVSVRRFIGLFPHQSCERSRSTASLDNTYWKIVRFGADAVAAVGGGREPHLLLRGPEKGYAATVGCNQFAGGYDRDGDRIELQPGPVTLMACQPPLAELEDRLMAMLDAARSWAIYGQVLELFDASGVSVATFEAVYLP